MAAFLAGLGNKPTQFPDCCPAVSRPLLDTLLETLPASPALSLSIGCGNGFLEGLLLALSQEEPRKTLLLHGVEVPSCVNKHLPESQLLRVPSTTSLHSDAMLATALMFIYPRSVSLVARYLESFYLGALDTVVWLGHESDWSDFEPHFLCHFDRVRHVSDAGIAQYERLVIGTWPKAVAEDYL